MGKVCGQVAVVTGAGSGEAISKTLSDNEIKLALLGRTEEKLTRVQREIESMGGEASVFICDVSDMARVESVRAEVLERLGQPSILVNNAGLHCELTPIAETTPRSWIQTMNVNVIGPYLVTRAFLPGMLEKRWGAGSVVCFAGCR